MAALTRVPEGGILLQLVACVLASVGALARFPAGGIVLRQAALNSVQSAFVVHVRSHRYISSGDLVLPSIAVCMWARIHPSAGHPPACVWPPQLPSSHPPQASSAASDPRMAPPLPGVTATWWEPTAAHGVATPPASSRSITSCTHATQHTRAKWQTGGSQTEMLSGVRPAALACQPPRATPAAMPRTASQPAAPCLVLPSQLRAVPQRGRRPALVLPRLCRPSEAGVHRPPVPSRGHQPAQLLQKENGWVSEASHSGNGSGRALSDSPHAACEPQSRAASCARAVAAGTGS